MNFRSRFIFGLIAIFALSIVVPSIEAQIFRRGLCNHRCCGRQPLRRNCAYQICCTSSKVVCADCTIAYETDKFVEIRSCMNPDKCKCNIPITAGTTAPGNADCGPTEVELTDKNFFLQIGNYSGDLLPTKSFLLNLADGETASFDMKPIKLASRRIWLGGPLCQDWWLVTIHKLENEIQSPSPPDPPDASEPNTLPGKDSFKILWKGGTITGTVYDDDSYMTKSVEFGYFKVSLKRLYNQ